MKPPGPGELFRIGTCEDWEREQNGGSNSMDRWNDNLIQPHLPRPPARILDVGCGEKGELAAMLRGMGYDAQGLDVRARPDLVLDVRAVKDRLRR
jgi:2-polyprenyl-3-methyl-5-hydroxy-6-metoxy-1,4-benzoquinol methylase